MAAYSKVDMGVRGVYDKRNKLNDLTGKEWLRSSRSVWTSRRCALDADAFEHPAPFLVKDVKRLIEIFTKKGERVADVFMGSGTTVLAAALCGRHGIGIDLNPEYCSLARRRLAKSKVRKNMYDVIEGDSLNLIDDLDEIDYCVTSPPYHNILRNSGLGVRHDGSQRRQGVDYYSDSPDDVGNKATYLEYLESLRDIMTKLYGKLGRRRYCTVVISDFTVNKKETNAHGDAIGLMQDIGFEFVGCMILVQDSKPLYPFGYPYAFKINHVHQYLLNFRKE
jgi:DNA modification methylase